jgi:hypothetical protein
LPREGCGVPPGLTRAKVELEAIRALLSQGQSLIHVAVESMRKQVTVLNGMKISCKLLA